MFSADYSHPSFLLVPLLAPGDSPKFLGSLEGLLYRLENENCMCYISYMYIRGSHKIYLEMKGQCPVFCAKNDWSLKTAFVFLIYFSVLPMLYLKDNILF